MRPNWLDARRRRSRRTRGCALEGVPGPKYTLQVAPEDCTGCALCVDACPVKDKSNVSRKAINMADQLPLRESEAANWDFFLNLPETTDPRHAQVEQRQERAALAAALRVLRRVRRLRRDALPQADQPVVRRPFGDRQRHRLLQHLRRQPADDAVGGEPGRARPGVVELAVRGQRRVRPGHAPDARQAERIRARAGGAAARRDRRRAGRRAAQRRSERRSAASPPSASAWCS